MTTEKKDPALRTTMRPAAAVVTHPEKGPADPNGETSATTTVPPVEEEVAESPEGIQPDADGAKPEDEGKEDEPAPSAPVEEFEIFTDDDLEEGKTPEESAAFYRMRKAEAEAERLKRELEALKAPPGVADPGPEPTSEDCAFDEAELKRRLREWDRKKAAFEEHKAKAAEQEAARGRELTNRLNSYVMAGAELSKRVNGFKEAEEVVAKTMTEDRKVAILTYADKPAHVVYYLGRHPEKLAEFANETDLGRFTTKLAKLEVSMKERKKNQAPPPEQSPRGSGAVNAGDSTLEKLRARAQITGDYAPVNAYKRKLREQREQGRR
jgi:hypothetical protein